MTERKDEVVDSPTPQCLVALPEENSKVWEKWIHYKLAEKEVKDELSKLKSETEKAVSGQGDAIQTQQGKIQFIRSETKKPKDSIQKFLLDKGYLHLCKKDDIDLKKVNDLVKAGAIPEDELNEHLDIASKEYLSLKGGK